MVVEHEISTIFHLASILSTKAEYNPETAHRINVEGTLNLLRLAVEQSQWQGTPVKFVYPSSIAAYGIPTLEEKNKAGAAKEDEWHHPTTMYGCNKLYCENLGHYYGAFYRQLAADCGTSETVDSAPCASRLISAETSHRRTSDYGPECCMPQHRRTYSCFVRPDTTIPFMVMPDAVKALVNLAEAPRERISQIVYNVTSFSLSAEDIYKIVLKAFPEAQIDFNVDTCRQKIVDTWPEEVDDSAACRDWNWKPDYDCDRAFNEYLIPAIRARYQK